MLAPAPSRYLSFAPLRRPGAALSVRDPATEVCRAFEWQCRHRERDGSVPNNFYLFPMGMAMSVLDDDDEYRAWIARLLGSSRYTDGYGFRGSLGRGANPAGFGYYLTREALDPEVQGLGSRNEDLKALIGVFPGAGEDEDQEDV